MKIRANIIEALRRMEAESAVSSAKFAMEHAKHRAEMIKSMGIEWVEQIDKEVQREQQY